MRLYVVSDLHIHCTNLTDIKEIFNWILSEHQPEFLAILGDVFHEHQNINVFTLNFVSDLLDMLATRVKRLLITVGNHDLASPAQYFTSTNHSLYSFKRRWNNVIIVDEPSVLRLDGIKTAWVPYAPDNQFKVDTQNFMNSKNKNWKNSKIVFAHSSMRCKGLAIPSSVVSEKWDEKPLYISGHIHEPLNDKKSQVFFVGSVIPHSFAETNNKRMMVISTQKGKGFSLQSLNLPTTTSRQCFKYTLNSLDDLETLVSKSPELPSDEKKKIVIKCETQLLASTSKSEQVKRLKERGYSVQFDVAPSLRDSSEEIHAPKKVCFDEIFEDALQKKDVYDFYKNQKL